MITRSEAADVFQQWWADYEAAPEKFPGRLKGRESAEDSANVFFDYALKKGALIADA
jgi:hypothetical protein